MLQLFNSLQGAAAQGLIWGLMAIGVYITFKILSISDLTVDGSMVTGAAVCTMLMIGGMNPYLAMLCAMLSGGLCGLVTGLLHTVLEIPAILAGILTQLALWSVNLKIMDGANASLPARNYDVIITQMSQIEAIAVLVVISAVVIGLLYWFFGTELGCSIRATGCNINMSRAQGINTEFNKVLGLVISNAIVALAGALLAQYQGFSDINLGRGAIVIGLASIVIGEVFFSRIARNFALRLCGVLVGGVVYYMVYQIIVFMGLDTDLLRMFSAVVVALFLGVPNLKNKFFSSPSGKNTVKGDGKNA